MDSRRRNIERRTSNVGRSIANVETALDRRSMFDVGCSMFLICGETLISAPKELWESAGGKPKRSPWCKGQFAPGRVRRKGWRGRGFPTPLPGRLSFGHSTGGCVRLTHLPPANFLRPFGAMGGSISLLSWLPYNFSRFSCHTFARADIYR